MTKRDYNEIASAFRSTKPANDKVQAIVQWSTDVMAMAAVLAADNPRFDRDRFFEAAGSSMRATPS